MSYYYDAILGLIPLALLGVAGGLYVLGLPFTFATAIGATTAALMIGHAMFVNGPTGSSQPYGAQGTN